MEVFNAELVEKLQNKTVVMEFTMNYSDLERLRSLLKYAFPDYNGGGLDYTKRYYYAYKSEQNLIWTCGYSLPDPTIPVVPFDLFFVESPVDVLFGKSMGKPTRAEELEAQAYLEYVLEPKTRAKIRLMRDIEHWAKQRDVDFHVLLYLLMSDNRKTYVNVSTNTFDAARNLFGSRLKDLT